MLLKNTLSLLILGFLFAACGSDTAEKTADSSESNTEKTVELTEDEKLDLEVFKIPSNARVYFSNIYDGDEVSSPVKINMAVEGMMVEPAGPPKVGYGHHHILVNREFVKLKDPVPMDMPKEQLKNDEVYNLHYGKGQETTELDLAPGKYFLTMQFADGMHRSYGKKLAKTISITVK